MTLGPTTIKLGPVKPSVPYTSITIAPFFAGCITRGNSHACITTSISCLSCAMGPQQEAQARSHLGHLEDLCWSCLSVREPLVSAVRERGDRDRPGSVVAIKRRAIISRRKCTDASDKCDTGQQASVDCSGSVRALTGRAQLGLHRGGGVVEHLSRGIDPTVSGGDHRQERMIIIITIRQERKADYRGSSGIGGSFRHAPQRQLTARVYVLRASDPPVLPRMTSASRAKGGARQPLRGSSS
jgi:hypothetical protein